MTRIRPHVNQGRHLARRFVTPLAALGAALLLVLPAGAPAFPLDAPEGYSLSARALLGSSETDLYLTVAGAPVPEELGLVQVQAFKANGEHTWTKTFHGVPSPGGNAVLALAGLERNQVVEVKAHAKDRDQDNIRANAVVKLRPDLAVKASAPARVVRTHGFAVEVNASELAGDTGAEAAVALLENGVTLATREVTVAAGGSTSVSFPLHYPNAGSHNLRVEVSAASPAESEVSNNTAATTVDVARYDFDGAVSSDEPEATRIGREVLEAGGNAVDAAVAVQAALSVTQPQNVGPGGGATIVAHIEGKGDFAIDARELSPLDTDPDQYHPAGSPNLKTNANSSGFIVGVPGAYPAAERMLERWGTRSWKELHQPAIRLAEEGFAVGRALSDATAPGRRCQTMGQPETRALYCSGPGLEAGSMFKQPDLAKTLRLVAEQGSQVLYHGDIAAAIVQATRRNRVPDGSGVGKMTLEDLASYEFDEEDPIEVEYRGHRLMSLGGASAGGYITLQTLRMLELRRDDFPLGDASRGFGWLTPDSAQIMTEAHALAFADGRFYWTGDGAVPREELLSDCYLRPRAELIRLDRRIPRPNSVPVRPVGNPLACTAEVEANDDVMESAAAGGRDLTSHFSVVDKWGNAVSFTTTLTDAFGSGILVPGYGFVLNDALSNFSPAPTARPGAFPSPGDPGLNDPAGHKRPRGNTAPLIAMKGDEPVLVTGSPGGTSIPSVVINVVVNRLDHGMEIQDAVDRPRIWWNLSTVLWNVGVPQESLDHLRAMGNAMAGPAGPGQVGGAQSIAVDDSTFALSVAKDRLIPDAAAELVPPH